MKIEILVLLAFITVLLMIFVNRPRETEEKKKEREKRLYEKLTKMGYKVVSIKEKRITFKELIKRLFDILLAKFKKK